MSYVQDNLMSGESIIKQAKVHWSIYLFPICLGILGVVYSNSDAVTFFAILAPLFWFSAFIYRLSTELVVTNKRLIAKQGLIARRTIELNLDKVESLNVNQGILGRILGAGTLIVNGTGGVKTPFKVIDNPIAFRRAVNEQVEAAKVAKA